MDGVFFEDLSVGQTASFGKTVTPSPALTAACNPFKLGLVYTIRQDRLIPSRVASARLR